MHYLGVDYHKDYSVCTLIDEQGQEIEQRRIANTKAEVEMLLESYPRVLAVMEAGRNWTVMYDWLEELTEEVKLAHPLKVKAVASAKIKTDKIDSGILAQLLRADLLPTAHVPDMETRNARAILRQRMFFVNLQTAVKNRITTLVDKYKVQQQLEAPVKTLFCQTGIEWLKITEISEADRKILDQDLALLVELKKRIAASDGLVETLAEGNPDIARLRTVPGIGKFLSVLICFEIDDINRFETPKKLCAYAGIVPSTHQSGKNLYHGQITKEGNKWLRYALVEAVRGAVIKDLSLREYYQRIKQRKGANPAKVATARRLLTICFKVLRDKRDFQVRLP